MNAKSGKFGSRFQGNGFRYGKLAKIVIITILIIAGMYMWLKWSANNDTKTMQNFDECYTSYQKYALSTEYVPYMQDCMR